MLLKRTFLIFLLLPFILNGVSVNTFAQEKITESSSPFSSQILIKSKPLDQRAQILAAYFIQHNSPVVNYAQDFIDAADQYNLDWKLIPAISGVESTFCQFIPGGQNQNSTSYNCWGWGVYGNQIHGFKSFRDGIFQVAQGLRTNYYNKGLTNPYSINQVYASSPSWGSRVVFFLSDLDKFESEYQINQVQQVKLTKFNLSNNIAGISAVQKSNISY